MPEICLEPAPTSLKAAVHDPHKQMSFKMCFYELTVLQLYEHEVKEGEIKHRGNQKHD